MSHHPMCGIVGAIAQRPVAAILLEGLRQEQRAAGQHFSSETDTEVIVHSIYDALIAGHPLIEAVCRVTARMTGAYALALIEFANIKTVAIMACGTSKLMLAFIYASQSSRSRAMGREMRYSAEKAKVILIDAQAYQCLCGPADEEPQS